MRQTMPRSTSPTASTAATTCATGARCSRTRNCSTCRATAGGCGSSASRCDGGAKYLRLSPLRADAGAAAVGRARGIRGGGGRSDWQWESLQGRAVEERGKTYHDFIVDGRFPFARVDVDTAGNDANEWTLQSRDDEDAPWITRAGPWVAFQVGIAAGRQRGRSAPQEFGSVVRDRHWRLSSRSPASGAPTLRLGYRPEVVVFLAQGKPPYALAAGSARAARADAPLPQLVEALRTQRGRDWQPASATLGATQTLAGERALAPKRDWTSWLLWSLLVLARSLSPDSRSAFCAGAAATARLFSVSVPRRDAVLRPPTLAPRPRRKRDEPRW